MIPSLAVLVGLLVQTAGHPHVARATRAPDPVRVWRADSILYVTLREPGHVVLLHVDAIGRVRVLFPLAPDDTTAISGGGPLAVPLPPTAQGNPSTFIAVSSRWSFEFAALRAGPTWNYYDALLLQPTAGDPVAALLDITDRITDGRPYDYGVVTYTRAGTAATRRTPLQPTVCLSCVRRGTAVAAAPAAIPTSAVDCSNASLTNSFCGVNSGSVSISNVSQLSYQPAPVAAAAPVYVPYYVPLIVRGEHRRFEHPRFESPMSTPRPSMGVAYPIAPRLIVPSGAQLRSFAGRRH